MTELWGKKIRIIDSLNGATHRMLPVNLVDELWPLFFDGRRKKPSVRFCGLNHYIHYRISETQSRSIDQRTHHVRLLPDSVNADSIFECVLPLFSCCVTCNIEGISSIHGTRRVVYCERVYWHRLSSNIVQDAAILSFLPSRLRRPCE
jgi:hypothetical protein